ncbi:Uncharacterised protein [Flavonifractor plautii]|uniref:Uncharacterized protein n=1 Tax=Flavonifractor plautii TaxID=292800 RepID=A0A174RX40_FLAPL|nr:Uncharacterised protein [Flavonifractor plautii]
MRGYSVRLAPSSSTEGVLLVCTRFSEGGVSAGVLAEQAARDAVSVRAIRADRVFFPTCIIGLSFPFFECAMYLPL